MINEIQGLGFRTLINSVKSFEQKGHHTIHLNSIHKDYQILELRKVSPIEYVAHLRDCQNKDNFLVGLSKDRYHIIKRWKNDIQR